MIQNYMPLAIEKNPIVEHIFSLHYFEYTKDFIYLGEAHDFWELVYIDDGDVVITAGSEELSLCKGQLYIHRPMEFHNIRCGQSDTSCAIIFTFSSPELALYGIAGRVLVGDAQDRELLHNIVRETKAMFISPIDDAYESNLIPAEHPPYGSDRLIVGYIETLLIDLVRQHCDWFRIPEARGAGADELLFANMCRYIEERYAQKLYLQDLCTAFSVSASTVKKLFAQKAGMGAIDYCISCRISRAKHLLRKGNMRISEVAFATGFSSLHYFSRTFRQHTGVSPSHYLKNVRTETRFSEGERE